MDDLMASIRKIISEDYGPSDTNGTTREPSWADGSVDLGAAERAAADAPQRMSANVEHDLSAFVAQSVRDALAQQPADDDDAPNIMADQGEDDGADEQSLALGAAIAAGSAAHHQAERDAARQAADRRAAAVESARRAASADTARRPMPQSEPDLHDVTPKRRAPRVSEVADDAGPSMSPRERLRALAGTARRAEDAPVQAPVVEQGDSIAVAAPHTLTDDDPYGEQRPARAAANFLATRAEAVGKGDGGEDGLTSMRTRHNVSSSFDALSRTILTNNPRTLEDLVRDMVRPLLREWLDANLSTIVERQVRQEIDRMSSRGR